jgi:hypothetical protein
MMGRYEPSDSIIPYPPDFDGNFRSVDNPADLPSPDNWYMDAKLGSANQSQWVALDGFTVTTVPEPSSVLLLFTSALLVLPRRRRNS